MNLKLDNYYNIFTKDSVYLLAKLDEVEGIFNPLTRKSTTTYVFKHKGKKVRIKQSEIETCEPCKIRE